MKLDKPRQSEITHYETGPIHPVHMRLIPGIISHVGQEAIETALEIIKNDTGGISTENKSPLTDFDLSYTPNNKTQIDYKDYALRRLELDKFNKTELKKLSECFNKAKNFLKNYLGIGLRKGLENLNKFQSEKDIIEFLKKTGISNKRNKQEPIAFHCALAKITLAYWEYNQAQLEGLNNEGEYLYNLLLRDSHGVKRIRKNGIIANKHAWIPSKNRRYRGKSEESCILKMLNKAEVKWENVIQDGIGVEFEVETKEHAVDCIAFLAIHLKELGANDIKFENVNFFNGDNAEIVQYDIESTYIDYSETINKRSGSKFQTAKFTGKIKVPINGDENNIFVDRTFEIQVIVEGNENNRGLNNHAVFKGLNKISGACRLFRTVSEEYIDKLAKETSTQCGVCFRKVKERFLEYIIPVKVKNGKHTRFTVPGHQKRWLEGGLVPKNFGK